MSDSQQSHGMQGEAGDAGEQGISQNPPDGTEQQYDERIPYNQQTRQAAGDPRQTNPANPQPGDEDSPTGSNEIPPPMTGEQRWVRAQTGALDSEGGHDWTNQVGTVTGPGTPGLVNQAGGVSGQGEWPPVGQDENAYTNPEYAGIQGNMMGSNPIIQGEPFEQGIPAGNEGFTENGVEGPPNEAYGQGKTRQFAPLGGEPGIVQQEVLQSQQYEREERRSQQGILGTVGDMLGGLFGNAKRTPDEDEDSGEAAGEAHP